MTTFSGLVNLSIEGMETQKNKKKAMTCGTFEDGV